IRAHRILRYDLVALGSARPHVGRHQLADRGEAGGAARAGLTPAFVGAGPRFRSGKPRFRGVGTNNGTRTPAFAGPAMEDIIVATLKAIVIEKREGSQQVALADFDAANLMDGDVTVRVEWSTLNYKDGLAITGKGPVVRRFPMIPGIDFAGTVESSTH